jgi:methylglutaconyl-CoA hydratase
MKLAGFEKLEVQRDGPILRIFLNDPERANSLSPLLLSELAQLFLNPWRDEGVRALLLAARGKSFCGGADLTHLASLQEADELQNRLDSRRLRRLFEAVLRQEALTVAAVQGWCVAGGCGLATACDFVVAAEGARFLYSEVRIGFVAALVATFLPLRVRGRDLREILLFPRPLDARQAEAIGLVDRVVPDAELLSSAENLVSDILKNGSSESIARTKRLLLEQVGLPLSERLDLASEMNAEARTTADCRRGIRTFLETRQTPDWSKVEAEKVVPPA